MMLATVLLGALSILSGLASATTAEELAAVTRATSMYPKCALGCLTEEVPKSECGLTDLNCLCTNEPLIAGIEHCVLAACSIYEGLQTKNVSSTMCGAPIRDKHTTPLVIAITMGTLATLSFVMRLCTSLGRSGGRPLGIDDLIAGAALLCAAPPTLLAIPFRDNGLGKDIWTLELPKIKNVLMFYYISSIFYIASITLVKISLLCFILRVFPSERFRRVCYGCMALVAAYGISFCTATALQCWPASHAWDQVDSSKVGKCNNIHLQAWMAAIFNIILDVVLLILPLPSLWALQMGLKKRLMIMVMFSLGIFVTIVSVVRLHSLIQFANSINITWDYVEPGYWSLVEMDVSIICACLPYCRHLLISFGASFLKSTQQDSRGFNSKASTGRRTTEGVVLSSSKQTEEQQAPKHGDESDFVPLVEYPCHTHSWKKTKTTVSAATTTGSTDSI